MATAADNSNVLFHTYSDKNLKIWDIWVCHTVVMLVMLLVLSATFAQEVSESLGKNSIRKRRETIYNAAFLSEFWTVIFLLATLAFGTTFKWEIASLPTVLARIALEIFLAYIVAELLVKAERSTVGFLRLLTIPLLLVVDLSLGYNISMLQIAGVMIMFLALGMASHHNPKGKKGAGLAVLSALIGVATTSLYKYNITHYNSVIGEQVVVTSAILLFFFVASGKSPMRLLFRPVTGAQALSNGAGGALLSFAYGFAPASIVMALKRTFALIWTIAFGHIYFHEKTLKQKVYSGAVMVVGLALLVLPSLRCGEQPSSGQKEICNLVIGCRASKYWAHTPLGLIFFVVLCFWGQETFFANHMIMQQLQRIAMRANHIVFARSKVQAVPKIGYASLHVPHRFSTQLLDSLIKWLDPLSLKVIALSYGECFCQSQVVYNLD